MVRFLYILATILIVIWAIGFFFYSLGAIIHLLLLLALLALLIRFFHRSKRVGRNTMDVNRKYTDSH